MKMHDDVWRGSAFFVSLARLSRVGFLRRVRPASHIKSNSLISNFGNGMVFL